MPANGRRDLIRRLKVNTASSIVTLCKWPSGMQVEQLIKIKFPIVINTLPSHNTLASDKIQSDTKKGPFEKPPKN